MSNCERRLEIGHILVTDVRGQIFVDSPPIVVDDIHSGESTFTISSSSVDDRIGVNHPAIVREIPQIW